MLVIYVCNQTAKGIVLIMVLGLATVAECFSKDVVKNIIVTSTQANNTLARQDWKIVKYPISPMAIVPDADT